jgi:hypothetical protein
MTTRDEMRAIVGYMSKAFSNYNPDISSQTNTVDVLLDLLGDLPVDLLKLAVRTACTQPGREFTPSAGEIRGMVVDLMMKASGVPTAGEAWEELRRYIGDHGSQNATPEFSHPLVTQAVRQIGLRQVGMSENEELTRAHFMRMYNELLERERARAALLPEAVKFIETYKQIEAKQDSTRLLEE